MFFMQFECVDFVFFDYSMLCMNGEEVFDVICEEDLNVVVLFMIGYDVERVLV